MLDYDRCGGALIPAAKIWPLALISHALIAAGFISEFLVVLHAEWNWWPTPELALGLYAWIPASAGLTLSVILVNHAKRRFMTRRMIALVWFGAIGNALAICYLALVTLVAMVPY